MNRSYAQPKNTTSMKKNDPKPPIRIRNAQNEDLVNLPLFKSVNPSIIQEFLGKDSESTTVNNKSVYKSYVCEIREKQKLSLTRDGKEYLYSIIEGHLRLSLPTSFKVDRSDAEYFVAWRGPEQILGEMSPLAGEPHPVTLTAMTKCELIEIPSQLFMKIADKNAILYRNLAELLIKKTFDERRHADLLQNVESFQQVVYTLLLLHKVRGYTLNEKKHHVINGIVRQSDIAAYLGWERQNVIEKLKGLKAEGIAACTGPGTNNAKVTIMNYEKLRELAPDLVEGADLEF